MEDTETLLRIFSQAPNRSILNLLAVEPSYPRRIAEHLSVPETEVARRLRRMERHGLVTGDWAYVGKNVKLYRLLVERVELELGGEGMAVKVHATGRKGPVIVREEVEVRVPKSESFVGRQDELDRLKGREPVVMVQGLPGIGKTSLAARHAQKAAGGRRVFWHSFRGVESLPWLANRFAAFEAQNGDAGLLEAVRRTTEPAELCELIWDRAEKQKMLVVLDDLHRVDDDGVRALIREAPTRLKHAKLVLTSRESVVPATDPERVRVVQLGGLDDEAVRRFCSTKGIKIPAGLVPRLRQELGGHPMGLNLFLETVKEHGVEAEALLDRIPERNLQEYLLQEIHESLSDDERRVLGLASLFRADFAQQDLAAVATRSVQGGLIKARRRLLVQPLEHGYVVHEVVRNFFYHLLQDKQKLHEKLANHYLRRGTVEGRLEAYHHLNAAGRKDRILHLIEEDLDLGEFERLGPGYQDLYLQVLDLFAKSEVDDARRWALIQDEKGDIHLNRGDAKKALAFYDEADAYFRGRDDPGRHADLAWKRAMALEGLGKRDAARTLLTQALEGDRVPRRQRERLDQLRKRLEE